MTWMMPRHRFLSLQTGDASAISQSTTLKILELTEKEKREPFMLGLALASIAAPPKSQLEGAGFFW